MVLVGLVACFMQVQTFFTVCMAHCWLTMAANEVVRWKAKTRLSGLKDLM